MTTRKTSSTKSPTRKRRAADGTTQTERLVRLEEGLASLKTAQCSHMDALNSTLLLINSQLEKLDGKLDGALHGESGRPGALMKIDRLEQSMAQAKLVVRLLMGTVISLVVGGLWALMTGKVS